MTAVVALAVVVSPAGVLLIRRADATPPVAFPGGRVESGEMPAQAAAREVLEETGLAVDSGVELARRIHPATGVDVVYLACRPVDAGAAPTPAPREVTSVAWWPVEEALAAMPDLHPPVRAWLVDRLRGRGDKARYQRD